MYQHDPSHTGATNNTAPKYSPAILWSLESKGIEISVSPAIANGIIYASTTDLYAYNISTGETLWNVTYGGKTSPVYANGIVYTGAGQGTAYNATTGTIIWRVNNTDLYTNAIAYYEGIVYTTTEDSAQARNATTGKTIWRSASVAYFVHPTISEGIIYCKSLNDSTILKAVNAYNGSLIWQTKVSKTEQISAPTVSFGRMYVSDYGQTIYCLAAKTGEKLWNATTSGAIRSSLVSAYGYIYFGSLDGKIYALNASTGQMIWTYKTEELEGYGVESSPTVADRVLYIGAGDGNLYALDAYTGTKLWSLKVGSVYDNERRGLYGFISAPAIAYDNIYIITTDHFLMAISGKIQNTEDTSNQRIFESVLIILIVSIFAILIVVIRFYKK
jgi:eukaryotic-like serine/threonine-protein kinase